MAFLFNQSCTLQGDTLSGRFFGIQPDLLLVFGQALGIIFRTELSRIVCTTQVMSKSGGSCSHSLRSPFLYITLIFTFFHSSGVKLFLFMISLKSCLTMSLVSSSQAVMSSARIPLLSGDLPFLSLLIALCNSSVVISGILLSSLVSCSKSSLSLSS